MSEFNPAAYGPAWTDLLDIDRCRSLGPGQPDSRARSRLAALDIGVAFAGQRVVDEEMAHCCLSAVWLLHDFLDESHAISQDVPTPAGSYWHGVMHRREGDFSNAKYWFRRAGAQPMNDDLAQRVTQFAAERSVAAVGLDAKSAWDPFAFVDACQTVVRQAGDGDLCRSIQQAEWELLFDECYRAATSEP